MHAPALVRRPGPARRPVPWPDLLSGLRLLLVPALLALAWHGAAAPFLALLALALATDTLDGFLARRLGLASERGAKLDSRADLAFWLAMPACLAWLRPDVLRAAAPELAVLVACLALPTLVGLAKFRRLTSYHTWGAKLTAVVLAATLLGLFAGGSHAFLRVAAVVAALSQLEEIAITLTLPAWRADVPTLVHARRLARGREGPPAAGSGSGKAGPVW